MTLNLGCWYWKLGLVSLLAVGEASTEFGDCALAQITPDGTLPNNSIVTSSGNTSRISGGTQAGGNLFHSFEQFSIPTGDAAYFNNALDIQNIFSRVTGSSISNIDGLIRANGTANLFLINPNGIIFGPNATLNIGGSILASTASGLNFTDGTQFSATAPQTTPLLTVSVPIGLQYGGTVGNILNQSKATNSSDEVVGLQVQLGKTLMLIGGNVELDGGNLFAPGGRVELGGLVGAGRVGLQVDSNNLSLSFPIGVQRADVSLTNAGEVNVRASGGGSVAINAQNLNLVGGSKLQVGINSGLGSPGIEAGDVEINATGIINLTNESFIRNEVLSGAVGNAGDITINAGSLSLSDGAQLSSSSSGQGNAGNVVLQTDESVSLTNSDIFSTVESGAVGNGGLIDIKAGSLSLTDGAQIITSVLGATEELAGGRGNAGSVKINVRDVVTIAGSNDDGFASAIFSDLEAGAFGNAGDITINAGSLSLSDGAQLSSSSSGQGNAGSVVLQADESVDLANSEIFNTVESGAVGNGGLIDINAKSLSLTNGAQILTSIAGATEELAGGRGNAGNVKIDVSDTVTIAGSNDDGFGSAIFSDLEAGAVGKGGNININAGSLSLNDGAQLITDTSGEGDAGSVVLQAAELVSLANGDILSKVESGAVGNSGDINITTGSLSLSDGAQLVTSTSGKGSAGLVSVQTDGTVLMAGDSTAIFTNVDSTGIGNGGDISIKAGSLFIKSGAELQTTIFGANNNRGLPGGLGNGGNVILDVRDRITLDGSSGRFLTGVLSGTGGPGAVGNGGNITVKARALSLIEGAVLDADNNGQGNGGNINIQVESLLLTNNAQLSTQTTRQGNAGSIFVQANDSISLANSSLILSSVASEAVGKGGNINLEAQTLSVTNGAQLIANTRGQGDAGSVNINARESVSFNGVGSNGFASAAFSGVESGAVGNGGGINITTGSLSLINGAQLSASTRGQGNGGNITVNANTLKAFTGGQVLTTSFSSGNAGNITFNVTDSITLAGSDRTYNARLAQFGEAVVSGPGSASGLFANTLENSTGQGGDLRITTGQLVVRDGALVTVSSEGSGNAGDLLIEAGGLLLDNQGKLRASTALGEGGNITLQVRDLILMRRNSSISAEARGTGNGGNITTNARFIVSVPFENSDLIANAVKGRGGNINITTQGIYGLKYRDQLTPESDISASSEFGVDGVVEIDTPDVDPSQGLVSLAAELVDVSELIVSGCGARPGQGQSEFIITGRGGLPPAPSNSLSSDTVWTDLRSQTRLAENRPSSESTTQPTNSRTQQLVEAQGWVINNKGKVVLTATAPNVTPHSPWIPSATCQTPETSS